MQGPRSPTSPGAIPPIAMPGIHERFWPFFLQLVAHAPAERRRVLDAGAGHGALAQRLHEAGFVVSACDAAPERFRYTAVECRRADLTEHLPYDDAAFDFVVALEVLEHLLDHRRFFAECQRVLQDGGRFVVSTPNILSLKSRVRFLLSGFFYSFRPLDLGRDDGLQHVSSRTLDQFRFLAARTGFTLETVAADRYQRSSAGLLWFASLVYVHAKLAGLPFAAHNTRDVLLGRVLFLVFRKAPVAASGPR